MHRGPESIPLHNKINCPINQNVEIVKLDLNFFEAPKPSGDNIVNVTQISPQWFSVRKYKYILFLSPWLQWAEHIWPLFQFIPSVLNISLYFDYMLFYCVKRKYFSCLPMQSFLVNLLKQSWVSKPLHHHDNRRYITILFLSNK